MNKFEQVKKSGTIIYDYLRGSWSHGIGVEGKSDYDYGGVYVAPLDELLGLRGKYVEQVSDKKGDEAYFEFGRWIELLLKSNPSALESLFIDKKFVKGDVHPAVQRIIDNRQMFLTKECFNPLVGYAVQQIKKATGYNKKCNIPEDFQRKDILDFCYTFKGQGSQPIMEFLEENKLDQKYCGLVDIPNMPGTYGVYYDWAAFFYFENKTKWVEDWYNWESDYRKFFPTVTLMLAIKRRIDNKEFFGYGGIVHPDDKQRSNDVRLSSIPKGEMPICRMTYNKNGYESHCKKYKDWAEWKKNRNPVRFDDNKGYNFDAKNMCETVRLLHMGIELARDGEFNVERTWDRDFLLNIKNHKVSYEEIMRYVTEKKAEFDEYIKTSTLPDKLDYDKINELLIESRKLIYGL